MQKVKAIPTEAELFHKFSFRCSLTEYAPFDIEQKALRMGVRREVAERVVDRLLDENYLDEERFTRAFVHDKLELSHWGRLKISAALRQKRISSSIIQTELGKIDEDKYRAVLKEVLRSKSRQVSPDDQQQRTQKLLRFAASRGFEPHLIFEMLD